MANLDTMRRAFALEEEAPAEGGLEPRTTEERLAQYAAMDAAEEANAGLAGVPVDELRYARRGDARVAEKIGGNTTAEDVRELGLRNAGGIAVPPSMATPLDFARPINTKGSAVGLEQTGRLLRSRLDLPETVPSLSMPSGVPAKTTDFASLQKLMSPGALKAPEAQPIPVANASPTADATAPVASALPSAGPQNPAGTPNSADKDGMVAPSSEGAGGDAALGRLSLGQALTRALEGSGSIIAGRDLRSGAADTLGERMKQIEALRAKREEQSLVDAKERANNRAQVEYLMQRFPDRREALTGLLDMTKSPNFSQMLRVEEQVALDRAKKQDIGAKAEDRAKTQEYRAGTLDLKRDIAKDNRDYRAVQAGLKQAELNLRAAENERKATGSAEPTEKERSAFQTSMKPAENTAVSLKDADNLNSLSTGMLVSGKPPPFLTQSDIVSFVGIPPFEGAMRSRLAQSNPQAFDLLTQMARLKTMVGHEYFGSALSPAEAERQRQFLDFGVTDTPDSIARKMKSYHDTLADRATIFLRPRVLGRPLGNEWAQATGLDALSAPGGTFAGLLEAPKSATPKTVAAPAGAGSEGKVRMLSPDNRTARIPAAEVEARKAQGWKEAP